MTKQEHINFWLDSAENDWVTVEALNNAGRYIHSLFFAHLVLEKLCKAHWVKDNEDKFPPKTHNLVYLLGQTKLFLSPSHTDFLLLMNDFQLEGRYPDYQKKILTLYNANNTNEILTEVRKVKLWLISNLQ